MKTFEVNSAVTMDLPPDDPLAGFFRVKIKRLLRDPTSKARIIHNRIIHG